MIFPNACVDKFTLRPKSQEIRYAYFLSHWHSDHYMGITHGWNFGPIFCSQITRRILLTKYPKLQQKVQGLNINVWYEYQEKQQKCQQLTDQEFQVKNKDSKGIYLMLFDSNHIAGSVMYIFIHRQMNKTIFHTGDMRFNIEVVSNTPKLFRKVQTSQGNFKYFCKFRIDQLYLDNTYCDPIFDFPSRSKAMKLISQIIDLNLGKRVLLCTDTIGKEQAFLLLGQKYSTPIVLNQERYEYCKAMGIIRPLKTSKHKVSQVKPLERASLSENDSNCTEKFSFTLNPSDGWIQVIKKAEKEERIKQNPNSIAITMTGWANINDYQETGYNDYIVPYSLHSNFKELQLFMELIKPRKLLPIVIEREGKSQKFPEKTASYGSYMRSLSYMKQRGLQYFQKDLYWLNKSSSTFQIQRSDQKINIYQFNYQFFKTHIQNFYLIIQKTKRNGNVDTDGVKLVQDKSSLPKIALIILLLIQLIYISNTFFKRVQAKNMLEMERQEVEPQEIQDSQENEVQQSNRNKQLLIIFVVYLLLTIANRMSLLNLSTFKEKIAESMKKTADNTTRQFLNTIDIINGETLQGAWESVDTVKSDFLSQADGLFSIRFQRVTKFNKESDFTVQIEIKNGKYIDNGILKTKFYFKPENYISRIKHYPVENKTQYLFDLNKTTEMTHSFHRIFQTVYKDQVTPVKQFSMQIVRYTDSFEFNLRFSTLPPFTYKGELELIQQMQKIKEFQQEYQQAMRQTVLSQSKDGGFPYELVFHIQSSQSTMINQIILALVLGFITYCQVSAIANILINITNLKSVEHISILTLFLTVLWDEGFVFISFHQIYLNGQEALIMFICQAFGLALLALNLEIRLVYHIFQSRIGVDNFQLHVFKFHVIAYSSLILIYPILLFTNLNSYLFITACTLFIPQIIANGVYKVKPDSKDPYYSMFLLPRFISIIYLRGNPWNIYGLEPNFLLILGCCVIIGIQILALWIQKTYHPRKIVPKIFLPVVYNYCYDQIKDDDMNDSTKLQTSPRQCSICLDRLNKDISSKDTGSNTSTDSVQISRIMKTPCGHKYHGNCLVKWMKMKKECPLCRQSLPPYD